MINLTKDNIDKAIINKAYDMVRKSEAGYLYTDETICTFNSMLIFRDLFNNKCRILDEAFEKLYYIADKIIQCVRPTPEDELYTVTVVTTPSDADVTINGVGTKQRSLASGTKVNIVAHLDGYYDKTYTIESLIRDETVEIEFTEEDRLPRYFNVTVTTIPSNAVCRINGEVTKSDKILENKVCSIEVTADGYIPYTHSFVVTEDKNINVKLEVVPEEDIIITVNPTPSDAVVKIDGVTGNTRSVKKGNHTIVVTKSGMNTYTLTRYFGTNTVLEPKLTITVNVVTYPSDATVLMNGTQRRSITTIPGEVTIVVSKTGYVTKTITKVYNSNSTEEIRLDEEIRNATITVVAQPAGAVVKIDGVTTISKTVPVGTTVSVNVTLDGYIPYNNTYTVNEDMTVNITLKNTQTFNLLSYKSDRLIEGDSREGVVITYTIEDDETVYNFVNDSTIELPINKDIVFTCGAEGYGTETRRFNFTGNYSEEAAAVPLYPQTEPATQFTLTVNTVPADATVTIDGETTRQKVVSAGEHTVVVSKPGYVTNTRTITVDSNTTITVRLLSEVTTVNLSVVAVPNDAIITIDGDVTDNKDVTPGTSHTVVVRKTGYATYTQIVTVNENMTLEVTLKNTKTVRYNVTKEDSVVTSDIVFEMLQNGTYVQIPYGENIEVPFDTNITVRATAPGYQVVTRTDSFSSNVDAYEVAVVNILIPKVVVERVKITLNNVPYNCLRKVNGVNFGEDYVYVDKGSFVIIDLTCTGYNNYRIVLIPEEDKVITVNMQPYTTHSNSNNVIFHFEGSNRLQTFKIDNDISSYHGGSIEISKGTHTILSYIGIQGTSQVIEFTDVYNDNTDFCILIEQNV